MASINLAELKTEIQGIVESYLATTEESDLFSSAFIALEIDALFDEYKSIRNYPESVGDEDIEADVFRYFNRKKSYFGTQVVPAMLTKAGSEGLETLIDNQVSKYWGKSFENYFRDVAPYCEVV